MARRARDVPKQRLPEVEVTNIRRSNERIEFDVSRTGVPVMVKTSFYPNWEVTGADGPWRATPNFMVVVPTERHVVVIVRHDHRGVARPCLTVTGVVGLVLLVLWGRALYRPNATSSCDDARGYDFRPAPHRSGEDPRLSVADSLDSIFKAYDVRGVYPDEIDESVARRIGNAFVAFTSAARVLVGRDARPSSEPLTAAFIEGATIAGADVVDLGFASTDLCYFAAGTLDAPGRDVHRQPQPRAVQRRQAVPGGRRAHRPGHRPRRDQGAWSPAACSSAARTRAGSSVATCSPRSSPTCARSSTSPRWRRCASSPTPPTAWAAWSCPR